MSTTPPGRRAYAVALALLAVGAVTLLVSFGLPWASADVPLLAGSAELIRSQRFTGRDLFPGAAMAGWVALSAVAGIVATRSWGRVVVALLAVVAGLAALTAAVVFARSSGAVVADHVSGLVGTGEDVPSGVTGAWLLAALGGVVVVGAASWTAIRGRGWPVLGSRYERPTTEARAMSDWEAQDAGRDPTDDLVE